MDSYVLETIAGFGCCLVVVGSAMVYVQWKSKQVKNKPVDYNDYPVIKEIRGFKLDQDFLEEVNVQRITNGRRLLTFIEADKLSWTRSQYSPEVLISSAPGNDIKYVEDPFKFLVYYEGNLNPETDSLSVLESVIQADMSKDETKL